MQMGVIYVMTHDSIGLGEDGPTHQPIEHLASFRAMPNMLMMRPCGGNETAGAYKVAVSNRKRPSTIALSRQGMPNLPGCSVEGVEKGAYVIHGGDAKPDVIFIGTGSELPLAVEAAKKLEAEGKKVGWRHNSWRWGWNGAGTQSSLHYTVLAETGSQNTRQLSVIRCLPSCWFVYACCACITCELWYQLQQVQPV